MACEVCEHCHGPVSQNEAFTVREGYSYHEKCHKCYVCSETNLQEAEVFKGVIFCSSCSQRIFQGCSTARRTKNTSRRTREKSQKRRSHRTQDRRSARNDGILELSTLAVSSDSSRNSSEHQDSKLSKIKSIPTNEQTHVRREDNNNKINSLKKSSVEMGMTTEVTQELLMQMNCPVVTERKGSDKPKIKERRKKAECSDLRIAELGTSTEIANMALRNKSELPVIIKSETRMRKMESFSTSEFNQKSDDSGPQDDWIDSAYSSWRDSTRTHWMDRRIGSILKLPYMSFKRNILNRSSLISDLINTENDITLMKKIKLLFYEEITDHQKRGLQRLYSTINRKKKPQKLGWLDTVTNVCAESQQERSNRYNHRCKHFRASHSYRCMRAHVMRLAGPTVSELAGFRKKMKTIVSPRYFTDGSFTKTRAIMMTQACGNSQPGSTKV